MREIEEPYTCPHCWQRVTVLIDPSVERQEFVEDCQICCNPLSFSVHCAPGRVIDLSVSSVQDSE